MIRFIDANTGNVYNGNMPYIHWFDGKQSIGLNYDKRFIILADKEYVNISIDSEVFYLVDTNALIDGNKTHKNDKEYYDLNRIKTKSITSKGNAYQSPFYIHSFNIIAQGNYVGEIRDKFKIDNEEFLIGADFYDENDILSINLSNFGVDLSNEIQRAIYEKDINEQRPDYVLLNRKIKELLNEYINILGNKGSYKSLINSLNWFEYADLVKIHEYWKHSEINHNYLSKRDLTQYITKTIEDQLSNSVKTTYISLNSALEKITKNENGQIVFDDKYSESGSGDYLLNEPNPKLEEVALLWSKNEMALKMTLLGNFFATYFMPIHLDLIHSTIENVIYTDTIKVISGGLVNRFDTFDEIYTIDCELEPIYYLGNVKTYTNLDTPFGSIDEESEKIVGVDTEYICNETDETIIGENNKTFLNQYFNGIGTLVPFECVLDLAYGSAVITSGDIVINHYIDRNGKYVLVEGDTITRHTDNIRYEKDNTTAKIKFNILLQKAGKYKIQLAFRRSDGVQYVKTFDFLVDSSYNVDLKMYKLVPKGENNELNISAWFPKEGEEYQTTEIGSVADYVLNPIWKSIDNTYPIYTQFISATTKNLNTVHTNQVIIIEDHEGSCTLAKMGDGDTITINSTFFGQLDNNGYNVNMPGVVWFKFHENSVDDAGDAVTDVLIEWETSPTNYWIGINTEFNTEDSTKYAVVSRSKNRIWIRDMFVPYFYKLEEITQNNSEGDFEARVNEKTYMIDKEDVVCFLPDLKCVKKPRGFMWRFYNSTLNNQIIPITFRTGDSQIIRNGGKYLINDNKYNAPAEIFPSILQPLFGKYDFRVLPNSGYYDITFEYKLDDKETNNQSKTVCSQFILKKKEKEKIDDFIIIDEEIQNIDPNYEELKLMLEKILRKLNERGFEEDFLETSISDFLGK